MNTVQGLYTMIPSCTAYMLLTVKFVLLCMLYICTIACFVYNLMYNNYQLFNDYKDVYIVHYTMYTLYTLSYNFA